MAEGFRLDSDTGKFIVTDNGFAVGEDCCEGDCEHTDQPAAVVSNGNPDYVWSDFDGTYNCTVFSGGIWTYQFIKSPTIPHIFKFWIISCSGGTWCVIGHVRYGAGSGFQWHEPQDCPCSFPPYGTNVAEVVEGITCGCDGQLSGTFIIHKGSWTNEDYTDMYITIG